MGESASPAKLRKKLQNRLYTQRELSLIFTDVPNKTLIFWAREGLVEWVAETQDARGIARLYNRWNLFQIALVREIAGLGIPLKQIKIIMSWFEDFPTERHYEYDDEGNKIIQKLLPSEQFCSEEGFKYKLIITKNMENRGWQQPSIIGVSKLTNGDLLMTEFGSEIDFHTTVIINLSAIHIYVDSKIEKAGLS